jgi:hypothetical protein
MDRTGLTDAEVLVALYNASRPQGFGIFQALRDPTGVLNVKEAEKLLTGSRNEPGQPVTGTYFDYLYGRVIKTDVSENPLDLRLFDRDMGPGAGARAIEAMLRKVKGPDWLQEKP